MVTEATRDYPKPENWDEFEELVWDIFKRKWSDPNAKRYGRSGQPQQGVDVYGQPKEFDGDYVGVQCKKYEEGNLTEKVVRKEIERAEGYEKTEGDKKVKVKGFIPPIASFIIATTAPRDGALQEAIRLINEERKKEKKFLVDILFWDDLSSMLADPMNVDLRRKHYPTPQEDAQMDSAMKLALAELKAKQLRDYVNSLKPPEQPYRYLDYFDLEQRSVFYGREKAKQDLSEKIRQSRLTLLHAPSGAGKTSLLRAGMQAAFIESGHLPVYMPRPRWLQQAIRQHILPNPPYPEWYAEWKLSAVLARACQQLGDPNTLLVILIDQFEEFFIQSTPLEQQDFIDCLAECLEHPGLEQLRFVLAMRKDYFSDMALFEPRLPQIFQNSYRLPYLTRPEARQAIEEPLASRPIRWAAGAVDELLDYLEKGEIETPHLQLICSRLYNKALESGQVEIQVSGLDLESIHALYLEEEMAALAPPEFSPAQKELAWKLLKHLVTSAGTRQARPLAGLYELAPPEELDPVLKRLVNRRLLRRDDESLSGQATVEVAHDTLARKIQAYELPDEIRRKAARELISRGLEDWLTYPSKPLLDPARLSILDEYRADLAVPLLGETVSAARSIQAAEFMLRSAVRHMHACPDWLAIAFQNGVPEETIERLILHAENFRDRAALVTALGAMGERFIPDLCRMLTDEYPQVRMAAIAALEGLQPSGEWRAHLKYECYVPAGEFIMGDDKSGRGSEQPAHAVKLEAFYIGKHPVTNAEYQRYGEAINQPFEMPEGKETHPVVNVSWHDARNYATWANMRLLTEAEWEKAASWDPAGGGLKRIYPWGDEFDKTRCNTSASGIRSTTPVGKYSPQGDSPNGCADMAGNVYEWCSSRYMDYPYKKDDGREELTGSGEHLRLLRGGSFDGIPTFARCAYRDQSGQYVRLGSIGFRVGAGVPPALDS